MGIGGFFTVGERHSFSYGYSYSQTQKETITQSDDTAQDTNSIHMVIHLIMITFLQKLFLHPLV